MKLTIHLTILLLTLLTLAWAQDGKIPDSEPSIPPQAQKLSCPARVEFLGSAIQNFQAQITELQRRLIALLATNEQLRLNSALKVPQAEFLSSERRAIAGSGEDPNNCRVALLTGEIICNPLTPSPSP